MRVHSMPDTCTARHFYDFPQGWNVYKDYNERSGRSPYTEEWYDKEYIQPLRRQLHEQLNAAKGARIVSVFAFLTGKQESVGDLLVKEFGFERTFDAHNYKYPDSSRRLFMYTRDMNDWEIKQQEKITTNPFATTPVPVAGIPAARTEPAPPTLCAARRSIGNTTIRVNGAIVRPLGRLLSTLQGDQFVSATTGVRTHVHPFPENVWVAIPRELTVIPPTLHRQRVQVMQRDGRIINWTWNNWVDREDSQDIVAVKRIGS